MGSGNKVGSLRAVRQVVQISSGQRQLEHEQISGTGGPEAKWNSEGKEDVRKISLTVFFTRPGKLSYMYSFFHLKIFMEYILCVRIFINEPKV